MTPHRCAGAGVERIVDGLYGLAPKGLDHAAADAVQFSPLIPGSARLEEVRDGSLDRLVVMAPPGTIERRHVLGLGLRAMASDGELIVMAPKSKGGARLGDELRAFGCDVAEDARRHHRICTVVRPGRPVRIEEAIEAGAPRLVAALGLWSQPGVFSWDRIDPGTALLLDHLPPLAGRGADFGCGIGVLDRAVLASPKVTLLTAIDVDRRAIDAARRNLDDPRVDLRWLDLRASPSGLDRLDFIVMNPPFHGSGGAEDQDLGRIFLRRAAESLRPGGVLWFVANRHLPYEAVLKPLFRQVRPAAERAGFKVIEARR